MAKKESASKVRDDVCVQNKVVSLEALPMSAPVLTAKYLVIGHTSKAMTIYEFETMEETIQFFKDRREAHLEEPEEYTVIRGRRLVVSDDLSYIFDGMTRHDFLSPHKTDSRATFTLEDIKGTANG